MTVAEKTTRRIRVLVAKPGLDGHDVGAKVVAQALRDGGMEVLYTGLRRTPEQIAKTALQEGVSAVGLSVLSGAHLPLCASVAATLQREGLSDLLLLVGGVIPEPDREALGKLGFRGIFPGGSRLDDIVAFVKEHAR